MKSSQRNPMPEQSRTSMTTFSTLPAADIDAIVGGYHGAPHEVLGPHVVTIDGSDALAIRAFRPLDEKVSVVMEKMPTAMTRVHPAGLFEAIFGGRSEPFAYRLLLKDGDGNEFEIEDPYRFPLLLSEYDRYLLAEGSLYESYRRLGAQFRTVELEHESKGSKKGKGSRKKQREAVRGVNFAVWAPNAQSVCVIGDFNGWDNRMHPMQKHSGNGIWELFVPNLVEGTTYKFFVRSTENGYTIDKADPYAFYSQKRPDNGSIVWDIDKHEWEDDAWIESRQERQALDQPINIYEVHLGSWKRAPEDNGFLNYRDLAHQLVDHARHMGYTHIELLPITEHPYDGSWGYQTTGYFAPTSRHGTPDDFKYFVDYCHQHDIGVILDWVPAHFPKDAHGLAFFDGTHLYEHADPRQGEQPDWGTKVFNFGRNEVRNFLLSSALFWLREYHLDGLRVDAVASMLYLDFSREAGGWLPNKFGGRENLEAIDFIRRFNEVTHAELPGILTIAEESTSWPMVTRPVYTGGLGFDLKWNMGWMHDMIDYAEQEPIHRRYVHNKITFSLTYAFSENFVLPFSHDEVVHLKKSMLGKMPGDWWQQFANLRALYGYMAAHPGKKLLFMGSEFGQWAEWNEAVSLDWNLLDFETHRGLQHYVATLNKLYRDEPALHEVDSSWEGFQWIDLSDAEQSIISFQRMAKDKDDHVIVVCNFTPVPRLDYRVGLPSDGVYRELFNSDAAEFGGSGVGNRERIEAKPIRWQNCEFSAPVNLPPLGVVMLKPERG